MPWKKLLACVTGQIDEALRQKLEFVLGENRVYDALLELHSPHWRLHDAERKGLAEKGKRWASCYRTSSPLCSWPPFPMPTLWMPIRRWTGIRAARCCSAMACISRSRVRPWLPTACMKSCRITSPTDKQKPNQRAPCLPQLRLGNLQ